MRQQRLDPQGEEDDAGDHREVQVGERVARDAHLLGAAARCAAGARRQARRSRSRPTTSPRPPPRRAARADDPRVELEAGRADPERDDRLAERDDDDQAVALGEVAGDDAPALGAAGDEAAVVDDQRADPAQRLRGAVERTGPTMSSAAAGSDRARQPPDDAPQLGIVAATIGKATRCIARTAKKAMPKISPSSPNARGTASEATSSAPIAASSTTRTGPSSEFARLASQT